MDISILHWGENMDEGWMMAKKTRDDIQLSLSPHPRGKVPTVRRAVKGSNPVKFTMIDDYDEVLSRLFKVDDDSRTMIGTARSHEPLGSLDGVGEWTLFSDYIMEGFVTYFLRLLKKDKGCGLEIRFTGTNRDRYIPFAVRDYIKWAGLKAEET